MIWCGMIARPLIGGIIRSRILTSPVPVLIPKSNVTIAMFTSSLISFLLLDIDIRYNFPTLNFSIVFVMEFFSDINIKLIVFTWNGKLLLPIDELTHVISLHVSIH